MCAYSDKYVLNRGVLSLKLSEMICSSCGSLWASDAASVSSLLTLLRSVRCNKNHKPTVMQLILFLFFFNNTEMLLLAASAKHVLTAYPLPPAPVWKEAFQQLSPAMSLLRQKWCIDREVAEAPTVQCNSVWDVYVTGEHILYMSAYSVQQQSESERRTHRDHLLFLFPDRTAADNTIRRGCRSERPGRRTICSLAVQGWSG